MWRWILLFLLGIVFLLLMLRVRLYLSFDHAFQCEVRVLFLRFRIFPRKLKLNLKQFSAKGISKKLKQDREKIAKAERKEKKKKTSEEQENKTQQILDTLRLVADILLAVKDEFFRYLTIRVAKLHLVIATDDAARTALEYGVAVQSVQYIVSILESITNLHAENSTSVYVGCDFSSQNTQFVLDISLSLRVWHIIAVLLRVAGVFLKNSGKHKTQITSLTEANDGRK